MAKPPKKPVPKKPPAKKAGKVETVAADPPLRKLENIDPEKGIVRMQTLRDKFSKALENPDVRAAMAKYLQELMRDGKQ